MPAFFNAIGTVFLNNLVTSGLIWHIDPRNTASYPGSGTTIYDLAGTKNGTFVGNTYVDGSGHLRLDGANDYVSFGTIATTDALSLINTSYTLNFWWYYVGTGDNYPHPFSMWRTTSQATQDGLLCAIERTSRRVIHFVNDGGTAAQNPTVSPDLTTLNTWEYWTMTYNISTNDSLIYKNGIQQTTLNRLLRPITNTAKLLRIGASNYDTFSDFNGRLGSYHVYNLVLTQAEILQNFNATKSGYGL